MKKLLEQIVAFFIKAATTAVIINPVLSSYLMTRNARVKDILAKTLDRPLQLQQFICGCFCHKPYSVNGFVKRMECCAWCFRDTEWEIEHAKARRRLEG